MTAMATDRRFDFMRRAARCFSFERLRNFYLVLTRPDPIRELTGCTYSDFCFDTEREALAFVRKIDEKTHGKTTTVEVRPKESFDCLRTSPWGVYVIPIYICDHRKIDVVGYIFTCGLTAFHARRKAILDGVRKWENIHRFSHMTYSFPVDGEEKQNV